jgi:DHA1 family inner membrane transport protein
MRRLNGHASSEVDMSGTPGHAPAPLSLRAILLIELALALGGFAIGTSEFAIMGLMPQVAKNLDISEPQVGHAISSYALGVVVGAPTLALLGARLLRKHLLLWLMGVFALGNFASAVAPSYHSLLAFRFFSGLPHGAYFGIAMLIAASMVPPHKRAKAVSHVLMGLSVAILAGNPLAIWLGQSFGWRYAFVMVSVIALLTVMMVSIFLPLEPNQARSNPVHELRAFNRAPIWLALAIGSVGFAGMFCVFSYISPTLLNVTGVSPGMIPIAVAIFGIGGLLGNIAGGWLFDRLQFKSVGWILLWAVAVLLLLPTATRSVWTVLPGIFALGSIAALSPALQTHLMNVGSKAQTLAAASNHAAFNIANALGPWLGGLAISAGFGWTSTGYIGASTAVAGLLIFCWAWRLQQQRASSCQGDT